MVGRERRSGGGREWSMAPGRVLREGRYRVEGVPGYGGAERLYLVSHTTGTRPLVLKQIRADRPLPERVREELDRALAERVSPGLSEWGGEHDFPPSGGPYTDRFLREALLLARLRHPALPTLYDYFLEDGCWYLVSEYWPGPTLASYIRQQAPLEPREALNYAMQVCDVLEYLHTQSPPVIFYDLKPANIVLTSGGRLMIVDLGIARYLKEGQISDTLDLGSPAYASPEQYRWNGGADGRSDLFSLGVILHEMISGRYPGERSGELEPLRRGRPTLSPVLGALVTVATRSDPLYRFQSARAFFQALDTTRTIEVRRAFAQRLHYLSETRSGEQGRGSRLSSVALEKLPHEPVKVEAVTSARRTFASSLTEALRTQQSLEVIEQEDDLHFWRQGRPHKGLLSVLLFALLFTMLALVLLVVMLSTLAH